MNVTLAHLITFVVFGSSISACAADETPAQVVSRLYRDFAWEAVIEEPNRVGETLIDEPKPILQRYFDDRLTSLVLQDRECVRRTREICRIDFVPIWDSQDPSGASDLHISTTDKANVVGVRFRYPNGDVVTLKYHMVRTSRGWRIADVDYPTQPSLLNQLTTKP